MRSRSDGNTLAMEPEAGGVMLAQLTPKGTAGWNSRWSAPRTATRR